MHYQERAQTKNNGNNPALKEFNKLKHLLSRYVLEWFKIIMLIANHFYRTHLHESHNDLGFII